MRISRRQCLPLCDKTSWDNETDSLLNIVKYSKRGKWAVLFSSLSFSFFILDQVSGKRLESNEKFEKNQSKYLQKCPLCGVQASGYSGVPRPRPRVAVEAYFSGARVPECHAECEAGAESHVCRAQTSHVARVRQDTSGRQEVQVRQYIYVL